MTKKFYFQWYISNISISFNFLRLFSRDLKCKKRKCYGTKTFVWKCVTRVSFCRPLLSVLRKDLPKSSLQKKYILLMYKNDNVLFSLSTFVVRFRSERKNLCLNKILETLNNWISILCGLIDLCMKMWFFFFTWNKYFNIKHYICHICNVK